MIGFYRYLATYPQRRKKTRKKIREQTEIIIKVALGGNESKIKLDKTR